VVKSGPLLELAADPDLAPLIGRFESGAVLACSIAAHDRSNAMTVVRFAGGELRVPAVDLAVGTMVRVRIRARDVALALHEPVDISISNRLPGTLARLTVADTGPYADAVVDVGGIPIRATLTRASAERLALRPGLPVWMLIKAVAFDSRSVGFRRRARRADDPTALG
jgi:molybdate transport system ATP-binding protein